MKKILITLLLLLATIAVSKSQELPIYSPVKIYGTLTVTQDVYFQKWGTQVDTMGLVLGKDGKIVMVPLVAKASDAWNVEQPPFREFFNEAKKLKALPLPSPDGYENRKMTAVNTVTGYSTEYELERLNIYLKRNWNADQARTVLIVLLFVGFLYQQGQIMKLKKSNKK